MSEAVIISGILMSRTFVALALAASVCFGQTDPFQSHVNIPAGDGTGSLALADFNGDGKTDIAVMNPLINTITVLLGDGKGGLSPAPGGALHLQVLGVRPRPLTTGDFNGDGKIDLAFLDYSPNAIGSSFTYNNKIHVHLGVGDGTFSPTPIISTFGTHSIPDRIAAADMNGDGNLDLAVDFRIRVSTRLVFWGVAVLGQGSGAFGSTSEGSTAFGDFNKDGWLDYAFGDASGGVEIYLSDSSGSYGFLPSFGANLTTAHEIRVADFDRDGALDLIGVGEGNVTSWRGDGSGGFLSAGNSNLSSSTTATAFTIGDFDGDGVTDWAVALGARVIVGLVRLPAPMGRTVQLTYDLFPNLADLGTADFDEDGKADLVVSNGVDLTIFLTGPQPPRSPQTITFDAIGDRSVDSGTFVASVSASSDLPVTLTANTPQVCMVTAHLVALIAPGTCTLRADQPGNTTTKAANPVYRSFAVTGVPQKIIVAPISALAVTTPPFHLQAKASSGLPVSVTAFNSCAVSGMVITLLRVGSCTVQISQRGNSLYAPIATAINFPVTSLELQPQVINFPPLNDRLLSRAAFSMPSITASSGLPVNLSSNTPQVCTVFESLGTYAVTTLTGGVCTLTASQGGSSQVHPAPPVIRSFNVLLPPKLSQAITTSAPSSVSLASTIATGLGIRATSGLPVSMVSNSPSVCSSSSAPTLLAVGTCSLTATQMGDDLYLAAEPLTITFNVVNGPTQTLKIYFPSIPNYALGTPPLQLSASRYPPSGGSSVPVVFSSISSAVCSVSGNMVTLLALGTCSVMASNPGNNIYLPAEPVTRNFEVIQGTSSQPQSIIFDNLRERFLDEWQGPSFMLNASATSQLPIVFVSETTTTCSVVGNTVALLAGGMCAITATQPGNDAFQPAVPLTRAFVVRSSQSLTQTVSFDPIPDLPLNTPSFALTASSSAGLPVVFDASGSVACSVSSNILTLRQEGFCFIRAMQPGDGIYQSAGTSRLFNVLPISVAAPAISSVRNEASLMAGVLSPSSQSTIAGTNFLVSPVVKLQDANSTEIILEQLSTEDSRINVLIPAGVALGPATIKVTNANGTAEHQVVIAATSPGLFSILGTGQGPAKAQIEVVNDGTASYYDVGDRALIIPTGGDVFITLDATGVRGHELNGVAGRIAGIPVQVLSAGAHPSTPGLDLVKLSVPRAAIEQGNVDIQITVDGVDSNTVTASFGEPRSRYTRSR